MKFANVEQYVRDLNDQRYGGYSDWRLPTLEEAMSLMEPTKNNNNLYIDLLFDERQKWIWTADKDTAGMGWRVVFDYGYCQSIKLEFTSSVRAVRSEQ